MALGSDHIGKARYVIGTSGYSFADWVGSFYEPSTRPQDMFKAYAEHFKAVELNFTFYRIEAASTLDKLARTSPADFGFWVKANRRITHEQDRLATQPFLENLQPLTDSGKLYGVLLQFPQSFHRTSASRKFLDSTLTLLDSLRLAVEFRHCSWDCDATVNSLRERAVTLVIPDCPDIASLYRPKPTLTSPVGYLRLHSRDPAKWYGGPAQRYDYNYTDSELKAIAEQWSASHIEAQNVFAFFNNCHLGQAARNAQAFSKILSLLAND